MPFIALLLSFFSLSSQATNEWDKLWLQSGCSLENAKGEEKNFPGALCLFLEDGSFISANENSIKRIGPSR